VAAVAGGDVAEDDVAAITVVSGVPLGPVFGAPNPALGAPNPALGAPKPVLGAPKPTPGAVFDAKGAGLPKGNVVPTDAGALAAGTGASTLGPMGFTASTSRAIVSARSS